MLSPASTFDDSFASGHGAFLHRAAHDPQFRAALEADPQTALAEYGLSVDPEQIPSEVTLPNAENILASFIDVEDPKDPNDPTKAPPWMWLVGT